jgi:hypothetical protein
MTYVFPLPITIPGNPTTDSGNPTTIPFFMKKWSDNFGNPGRIESEPWSDNFGTGGRILPEYAVRLLAMDNGFYC